MIKQSCPSIQVMLTITITKLLKGNADADGDVDINFYWQLVAKLKKAISNAQAKWNADLNDVNKIPLSE